MSLYSEYIPKLSGEKGEWAHITYADQVAYWKSWRHKAILIGPVATAYDGISPDYDNKINFAEPSLMICGMVKKARAIVDGEVINGIRVDFPLVYDSELKAFSESIDDIEDRVITNMWVPNTEANFFRSYSGKIPYVDLSGRRSEISPMQVTLTV